MVALDTSLLWLVYATGGAGVTWLAIVLSALGSGWVTLALLPLLVRPASRRVAAYLAGTLSVSAGLVTLAKAVVGRVRPCSSLSGVRALTPPPTDPSFPSGHACGSFAFAAFVVFVMYSGEEVTPSLRGPLAVLCVALAFGVGWSRVYLGVHFPADVAAGALLGVLGGLLGGLLFRRSGNKSSSALSSKELV